MINDNFKVLFSLGFIMYINIIFDIKKGYYEIFSIICFRIDIINIVLDYC